MIFCQIEKATTVESNVVSSVQPNIASSVAPNTVVNESINEAAPQPVAESTIISAPAETYSKPVSETTHYSAPVESTPGFRVVSETVNNPVSHSSYSTPSYAQSAPTQATPYYNSSALNTSLDRNDRVRGTDQKNPRRLKSISIVCIEVRTFPTFFECFEPPVLYTSDLT